MTSWPWPRPSTSVFLGGHDFTVRSKLSQKHQFNPPLVSHFKSESPSVTRCRAILRHQLSLSSPAGHQGQCPASQWEMQLPGPGGSCRLTVTDQLHLSNRAGQTLTLVWTPFIPAQTSAHGPIGPMMLKIREKCKDSHPWRTLESNTHGSLRPHSHTETHPGSGPWRSLHHTPPSPERSGKHFPSTTSAREP